ncbi:MAG TPA: hypothetical protein VGR26_14865 [Acidimicrobiales bacterium]|nr:hypothetical protein [Acidimicrobiales bacterium]
MSVVSVPPPTKAERPEPVIVFLADGEKGAEVARLLHEQWKRKSEKDGRP